MLDKEDIYMCTSIATILALVISAIGCGDGIKEVTYKRTKRPCEVIQKFEMCCGAFADRYMLTSANRYKISETANVVVGDSICEYAHKGDAIKGILGKDITLYE